MLKNGGKFLSTRKIQRKTPIRLFNILLKVKKHKEAKVKGTETCRDWKKSTNYDSYASY